MMNSLLKLKEPFVISESYDQAEVFSSILQRVSGGNDNPIQRAVLFTLWPFREENGVRVYSPGDRRLQVKIDDLSKPITDDPLMEDLRQKAVQADNLLILGVNVVKGVPGT